MPLPPPPLCSPSPVPDAADFALARVLWDYHRLGQTPVPADLIFVLGSNDLRVADRASELFHAGIAPLVAVSGGSGVLTAGLFPGSEASAFAARMRAGGVPAEALILEHVATNTGENVILTRRLLAEAGIAVCSAVCVQKPFMERRTRATVAVNWPGLACVVTSPCIGLDAYCDGVVRQAGGVLTPGDLISTMVGDLQRLIEYPRRGFCAAEAVPPRVLAAMTTLIARGYDCHLIADAVPDTSASSPAGGSARTAMSGDQGWG